MATFSYLPAELVEYIYSYLDQRDLYAVSQLNRGLHDLVIPFLYRNVDLFFRSDKLPRIDRFCMNVSKDQRLAARVETIRIGPSPDEGVQEGQRWIPKDIHFDDKAMFDLAMQALENESLVSRGDYLRDAIFMREYAAYAALILLILPSLQTLRIADFKCASLDHLHTVLRNINPGSDWNRRHASDSLLQRLSSISTVSFNVDNLSGVAYPNDTSRYNLEPQMNLPGIRHLEISVPDGQERTGAGALWSQTHRLISAPRDTNLTTLIVRHSSSVLQSLQPLLASAPQLQSLTFDFYFDCKDRADAPPRWIDLSAWTEAFPKSLKTLVLGVENCDSSAFPFKQPRIGEKLYGYLDLTNFANLHTLEVPIPFLTGDADFRMTTEIYPLLPPNLRHLSLRSDMSHAQHQFPFDTSVLPQGLSFQETEDELRHGQNARMDVSYMYHAAMVLLDFATDLETISIWQPADLSLVWFDGQVADFMQTCCNKSIKGNLIYPMLLQWKKPEHWNLVKEVTVYDPTLPSLGSYERFRRGERDGIPLGLASQYHLHALRNHQVRKVR
ncbi:hypothetical protein EK21DRAFT_104039 [Setomelanomma holmii]|uniref:F-box domain-containing protein n=1 Tax=Setomelanomma holmii TaxID=210430 RepID=A0A9P4H106_9PLEO|nr:hypothetical protein EK21DRAFT_104039 [Setomelanomma holmii]